MAKNSNPSTFTSSVIMTGTALEGTYAPSIGHVDIGISESAYLFRVALPGVQKDKCELDCQVDVEGRVYLQGILTTRELAKKNPVKYEMNVVQLSPPGPFSLSFKLPGGVDPRLFSANFRSDGILEGIAMKATSAPGATSGNVDAYEFRT